ncbi:MAG: PAS domain-containing protein [Pseudomonadota bacterium]
MQGFVFDALAVRHLVGEIMSAELPMHEMALQGAPVALVITNPTIKDNPIVFVNNAFTKLTGYAPEVSVGRNCRFLQGDDTDPDAVDKIRTGIKSDREFTVEILNYKADGTPFRNRIHIAPLKDPAGKTQFFVGLQRPADDMRDMAVLAERLDGSLRELHHRVKNHLSMVIGMIRMQARVENADSLENYATLARRIETLQLLYDEMNTGGMRGPGETDVALGAYVSRIASTIAYLDGRESVRLNLDVDNVRSPIDTAAQIGLLVSELVTNAYQHAFRDRSDGLVEVRLQSLSEGSVRIQVADDGIGVADDAGWPESGNLGGRIVRSLLGGLGATLNAGGGRGAVFIVDVPLSRLAERAPDVGDGTFPAAQQANPPAPH